MKKTVKYKLNMELEITFDVNDVVPWHTPYVQIGGVIEKGQLVVVPTVGEITDFKYTELAATDEEKTVKE